MAGNLPRGRNITLNASVLFFAFALSVAVGIAFGLMPALRSSATDVRAALKAGSRGTTVGHHCTQSALVILQISLALILLTGGSLLLRAIRNLLVVNPGFDPRHVLTFQIGLSPSVATPARIKLAYQELAARVRRIHSVQAADITALLPMGQGSNRAHSGSALVSLRRWPKFLGPFITHLARIISARCKSRCFAAASFPAPIPLLPNWSSSSTVCSRARISLIAMPSTRFSPFLIGEQIATSPSGSWALSVTSNSTDSTIR